MSSPATIQVSGVVGIAYTITRAAASLEKSGEVVLTAINSAIPRAVQAAELLKHRVKGLSQVNEIGRIEGTRKTRVQILLSLRGADEHAKGYQPPIPDSDVTVTSLLDLQIRPKRKVANAGTGQRGRPNAREQKTAFMARTERKPRQPRSFQGKYRKVSIPLDFEPSVPGVYQVSLSQSLAEYAQAADSWFRSGHDTLLLKGNGWALSHTVSVAETIKRAVKGLHQVASYGSVEIVDRFEPIETGLDVVTRKRSVPVMEIRLTVTPPSTYDPGYQPPLDVSLVKEPPFTP